MSELTQERLKELLDYNPDSGVFTWKERRKNKIKIGSRAGTLNGHGYIDIEIQKKKYKAHRLAWIYMTGAWPTDQINHKDHVRDNNMWSNLREATNQENHRNTAKRKCNTSGVTGVYWHKNIGKWIAQITVDRKAIYLGLFSVFDDAVKARKDAEKKYGFHVNHGLPLATQRSE